MKKIFGLFFALAAVISLASCGSKPVSTTILSNADKDYYLTGQFANWTTDSQFLMEPISMSDERVSSVLDQLDGATALYVLDQAIGQGSGWTTDVYKDGKVQKVDGYHCVKVIRTAKGDIDLIDFWAQAKESGEILNLTPSTLYIPKYRETDEKSDGQGTWADNPAIFDDGVYNIVFGAAKRDNKTVRFMGAIKIDGKDAAIANAEKDYSTVGAFNGWGDAVGKEGALMSPAKFTDSEMLPFYQQLKNVKALYSNDISLSNANGGFTVKYPGADKKDIVLDGGLTVKIVRSVANDPDLIDFWAQAKESGALTNLTPSTLFMPAYRETDAENDGLGTWADNPFAKAPGEYKVVYAEEAGSKFMGLVQVKAYSDASKEFSVSYSQIPDKADEAVATTTSLGGVASDFASLPKDLALNTPDFVYFASIKANDETNLGIKFNINNASDGKAIDSPVITNLTPKELIVAEDGTMSLAAMGQYAIIITQTTKDEKTTYQIAAVKTADISATERAYLRGAFSGEDWEVNAKYEMTAVDGDTKFAFLLTTTEANTLFKAYSSNADTWYNQIDTTNGLAELNAGNISIKAAGTYLIILDISGDTPVVKVEDGTTFLLVGSINDWKPLLGTPFVNNGDGKYTLTVDLKAGDEVKVTTPVLKDGALDATWYGDTANEGANFKIAEDGQYVITVTVTGTGETQTVAVTLVANK